MKPNLTPKHIEKLGREIRLHKERCAAFNPTFINHDIRDACEKLSVKDVPQLNAAQLQAISHAYSQNFELWWNSWIAPKVELLESILKKEASAATEAK